MTTAHELETVLLTPKDGTPHSPHWQVTLNEDGSLSVMSCGRRPGRMLVEPSSHVSITVTSEKIVAENHRNQQRHPQG